MRSEQLLFSTLSDVHLKKKKKKFLQVKVETGITMSLKEKKHALLTRKATMLVSKIHASYLFYNYATLLYFIFLTHSIFFN